MDELSISFKWLAGGYTALCLIACYAVHCVTRNKSGGESGGQRSSESENKLPED